MGELRLKDWFVVSVTDDGPSRIFGSQTFKTRGAATRAADQWLIEHPGNHVVCICQAVENRWRNPEVHILSDAPDPA